MSTDEQQFALSAVVLTFPAMLGGEPLYRRRLAQRIKQLCQSNPAEEPLNDLGLC